MAEAVGFGGIALDGEDIYWLESRPSEGGRRVIVRRTPDGETADVTPRPFNVRTRVHEYGEGDYTVDGGVVYFTNFDDQRLYRQEMGGEPEPVTPRLILPAGCGTRTSWLTVSETGSSASTKTTRAAGLSRPTPWPPCPWTGARRKC